jgi:molybdopterin-guanine dinucleotide biosynthesis protein A
MAALADRPGDLVVPVTARGVEPLVALYRPRALDALARRVAEGGFALHPLCAEPDLTVERLAADELARFGDPRAMFANLNTPEDLELYLEREGL